MLILKPLEFVSLPNTIGHTERHAEDVFDKEEDERSHDQVEKNDKDGSNDLSPDLDAIAHFGSMGPFCSREFGKICRYISGAPIIFSAHKKGSLSFCTYLCPYIVGILLHD